MRLPTRRGQNDRSEEETEIYLTPAGLERLKRTLADLERQHPQAIEDVSRLSQLGDFSENAEYQEAKHRMRRIEARIFSIKDRLKRVIPIEEGTAGKIRLGSTVVLEADGIRKTYQIVGPQESKPAQGRISHVSPIGSALIGHTVGDLVEIKTPNGTMTYRVTEVR